MNLDLDKLAAEFAADPRIVFAVLFGSSRDGTVRPGSDVDIGVLLDPALQPLDFYRFYVAMTARLKDIPELDLVDLNHAGTILAFEALCGRRLFVRDADAVATFSSRVAREYESDMLHATHVAACSTDLGLSMPPRPARRGRSFVHGQVPRSICLRVLHPNPA